MAIILTRGLPVNPALSWWQREAITCPSCLAVFHLTPADFVANSGTPALWIDSPPILIAGNCPNCYHHFTATDPALTPVGSIITASWYYAQSVGYAGVVLVRRQSWNAASEGRIVAVGVDGKGKVLPGQSGFTNYAWAILGRGVPTALLDNTWEWLTSLPGTRIDRTIAMAEDPNLIYLLDREGVPILGVTPI